jgi:8-oxo-dGTP pyrophosphatase MutT (NUDIX family)
MRQDAFCASVARHLSEFEEASGHRVDVQLIDNDEYFTNELAPYLDGEDPADVRADRMTEASSGFNDVVCGLLLSSGRILLVHRNAPGGHIEQGESDRDALARELLEELGIVVASDAARLVARLTGVQFDARVFVVDSWSGEPQNQAPEEHDDLAWFEEEQVFGLVLADPDLFDIIVEALHDAPGPDA